MTAAAVAEAEAIRTEGPVHNVAGSPTSPYKRDLLPDEVTLSVARSNLTEIVNQIRFGPGAIRIVGRTRKPIVAIVPFEFWQLVTAAGGIEAASAILRASLGNR